jgi:xylulokinase
VPWKQLLADIFEILLYATIVAAASARDAALLAGIGIRVHADAKDIRNLAIPALLAATPSVDAALEEAWIRYQILYPKLVRHL